MESFQSTRPTTANLVMPPSLEGYLKTNRGYLNQTHVRTHINMCRCTYMDTFSFLCSIKLAAVTDKLWSCLLYFQGHHISSISHNTTFGKYLLKERPPTKHVTLKCHFESLNIFRHKSKTMKQSKQSTE